MNPKEISRTAEAERPREVTVIAVSLRSGKVDAIRCCGKNGFI